MACLVDYWNGDGACMRTKPELQAALARRTPKVVLDFWPTMPEIDTPYGLSADRRPDAGPARR